MKRILRYLLFFLAFCIAFLLFANLYMVITSSKYILTPDELKTADADCVIVLGAKVVGETTLSYVLTSRMDAGVQAYEQGAAKKLLLSGDHGKKNYDEVNAMKQYAESKGISSDDIFLDHAGFSTYESMYRARDIFEAKKILISTQGFHLSRAIYIARSLGLEAYGIQAENPLSGAARWKNDIREVFARTKDFVTCIFKPLPTYLGKSIPISGSAVLTHDKS